MKYVALKAGTYGGKKYSAGQELPEGAVLPSRANALKRQGYIAELPQESVKIIGTIPSATEGAALIPVPLKGKDGDYVAFMTPDEIVSAISTVELNAKEAAKALEDVVSEKILALIGSLDQRKTVLTALEARYKAVAEQEIQEESEETAPEQEPAADEPANDQDEPAAPADGAEEG